MKTENKYGLMVGSVGSLVFALAVVSFALSFVAVSVRAEKVGMVGWLFVLMVDGAIIIFSILRMISAMRGYGGLSWGLALAIVGSTALSVWFNIGNGMGGLQTVIMHSLPPVFLLVSFEALMFFIHEETKYQTLVGTLQSTLKQIGYKANELQTINADIQTAAQTLMQTELEIERAELKRDRMTLTAVQKQIMLFLEQNQNIMTYQELADAMTQNKSTIYQPTRKLIDAGLVHKNGMGFELAHGDER